jgi:CMP-N-acetylneuraminic acid synthetase|tara:strand:- start:1840 stop:2526 length:687 start_codon:yes stop_codon:yes gene_type:complete
MKNINDLLFIVQARTNSQRVPAKMTREFAGTCLFEIFINKIKQTNIPMENFYASVCDQELIDICNKHEVNVYKRSIQSRNEEKQLPVMYEWWDKFPQYQYAVLFNPCLILMSPETIDRFVDEYLNSTHDGMFSVMDKKQYYWNKQGDLITDWPEGTTFMNTKLVDPTYEAAHGLYAGRLDLIGQNVWMGDFTKNNPELFVMDEFECLDIDYEWQFDIYTHYWQEHYAV